MATSDEMFAIGVQHHQAGELQIAEQIYRQILATDPNHSDAWHLLGVIASQIGRHDLAESYIRLAIEQNQAEPAFFSNLGNVLHAQSKFDEAISSFRCALALKPDDEGTLYNLGIVFKNQNKYDEAADCFRQALQLAPDFSDAHNYLGCVFQAQKKLEEAVACWNRALQLKPDFAEAHNNLGVIFQGQGKESDAIACFRRALEFRPDFAEAWSNLGDSLQRHSELDEAVRCCRRAIELKPDYAGAHINLGNALRDRNPPQEAMDCYRRAIELSPDSAAAYFNLGNVFQKQACNEDAMVCYRKTIELRPDHAEAHSNLGTLFDCQGKIVEAIVCYRRAAELSDLSENHYNLGTALQSDGKVDEAIESYHRALELRPEYPEAHNNLALLMLLKGNYQRGWTEYEWRWKANKRIKPTFTQPQWLGEPLNKRTILLYAEQGFGDTIQCVRFASCVKMQNPAATVIVQCQRRLAKLLAGCPYIDRVIAEGDELPDFDVHSPFFTLPLVFGTTVETIPANVPYVFADPALPEYWRQKFLELSGLRIGINWRGGTTLGPFGKRDIPLSYFSGITELPCVTLISLQKGEGREDLVGPSQASAILDLGPQFDTEHRAFLDTAAVMMNLDLVITSDTSVAHLAGALGVPVWVALPFVCDWRWLLDRSDSPWYPTMRLFRQQKAGDWGSVLSEIEVALKLWLGRLVH
jgi:tetratricopeptide (TPR) repeat protein